MSSDSLFGPLFAPASLREAVSARAWLQAMLDAERALALAEARAGVIPSEAAEAIAARCSAGLYDPEAIAAEADRVGNPAEPLARALAALVGEHGGWVHWGATSQDVLDTAAMLVCRRALDLVLAELDGVAAACATLADRHRATLLAARTLLQQALPTTFGLKAAGWLAAVLDGRRRLATLRETGLAAQLGGAAGTLASLGERGPAVLGLYAAELGLAEPVLPWHALRGRVAELAGALDVAAGALAKIALDVSLLAQSEVAEVAEAAAGGSSTLPHKRNPIGSALGVAGARRVHALATGLAGGLAQEHERAVGGWHAEWQPLADALALTGGVAARMREVVAGLDVDAERMRANLDASGGLLLAERVALLVGEKVGRLAGKELVAEACARALASGRSLREELAADGAVQAQLSPAELDAVFDPAGYLGSAEVFVDRVLDLYRRELG